MRSSRPSGGEFDAYLCHPLRRIGLAAAEVLLQLCVRRFGGITGDVLGALVEITTLVALLVLAV